VRIHRGILATVLLAALGLSGLAVGSYYWLLQLPHPSVATRDQLFRWLVLRDVAAEPPDVQQALVDRLQEELLAGLDANSNAEVLNERLRDQLRENVAALKRVWFELRTAQYAACPDEEKFAFLEQQIAVVAAWSTFQLDLRDGELPPGASPASQFFDDIERWIHEAQGEQHDQMVRGVQDGLVCWLATRSLEEQPMSMRRDLSMRIARELDYGLDLGSKLGEGESSMSAPQRRQLAANGLLLMEAWLGLQAQAYAQLEPAARIDFLDARIDAVEQWNVASLMSGEAEADNRPPDDSTASLAGLSKQVEIWIDRADPHERDAMRTLADDLRARVVWRSLRSLLPSF
jgi:hypothetical protein